MVLDDNRTIFDELCWKHPEGKEMNPSALVPETDDAGSFHPIIFDRLDGAFIREIASRMKGSTGPSGLDAEDWRQMCCSFKDASHHLCNTLADTAKHIAVNYINPRGLEALNASILMPWTRCLVFGQ